MAALEERPFTQDDYNEIVYALDKAMKTWSDLGKSETECRAILSDFLTGHYFTVWRKIVAAKPTDQGSYEK